VVRDRRAGRVARRPGAMEQTGTLRQLAGARSLSPFIRNRDSGQTDPCLPPQTALGERLWCGSSCCGLGYGSQVVCQTCHDLFTTHTAYNREFVRDWDALETKGQKLRSRKSRALPNTLSRIAGSGSRRAISTAPRSCGRLGNKIYAQYKQQRCCHKSGGRVCDSNHRISGPGPR
jgi:hypothetical protein